MSKKRTLADLVVGKRIEDERPAAVEPARRQVKKQSLRLDVPTWRALRALAVERDTTQRALVIEGLNMVFQKYGKPPIAE